MVPYISKVTTYTLQFTADERIKFLIMDIKDLLRKEKTSSRYHASRKTVCVCGKHFLLLWIYIQLRQCA